MMKSAFLSLNVSFVSVNTFHVILLTGIVNTCGVPEKWINNASTMCFTSKQLLK